MNNSNKICDLVDIMFNFDIEELEKETDFLKKYKELKEQNKIYKEILDKIKEYAGELRLFDNESVEFEISSKLLELSEEI